MTEAANPNARADRTAFRSMLSISTAHLAGDTLRATEQWTFETASVPMFGRHSFGFYCATFTAAQAAEDAEWPDVPADLRDALIWAQGQGAEYATFDCDGALHDALPDHEATHGDTEPCPDDLSAMPRRDALAVLGSV